MMLHTIRRRMLVAALAPVLLVIVLLVGVFFMGRVDDLGAAHQARGRLLVRQVAMASEYGLFSGNTAVLQSAASTVQRETDIRWAGVFDTEGHLMASAGVQPGADFNELLKPEYAQGLQALGLDALVEPITLSKTPLDDMFVLQGDVSPAVPLVLGYAVMVMSRDSLVQRERELAWVTLLVAAIGILLGGILAARLGERVVQPILGVSRRIGRIGQGDFSAPEQMLRDDPLYELQEGLNQMAIRLAWSRDELEQRVSDTTAQLRLKKEEAEDATRAKSQFMAAASHDLRQPTHALGLFVSRLGQLPLEEKARQIGRAHV